MSDFSEPFILMTKALAKSGSWATHKEWDKALKSLDDAVAFAKDYRVGLTEQKRRATIEAIAPIFRKTLRIL